MRHTSPLFTAVSRSGTAGVFLRILLFEQEEREVQEQQDEDAAKILTSASSPRDRDMALWLWVLRFLGPSVPRSSSAVDPENRGTENEELR
jgi:hypothetical protein